MALAFVLGLGASVLIGWCTGLKRLHTPIAALGQMAPLTALSFLLAGSSLWLWKSPPKRSRRYVAQFCGAAVAALGLLSSARYLYVWSIGVGARHSLVGKLLVDALASHHQMALNTAISFTLAGLALCLLDTQTRHRKFPAEWFILATAILALTALTGHIYRVQSLTSLLAQPFYPSKMALHTTFGLLVLCVAVLTARPERGWTARFTSNSPEGIMARRLLPTGILILLAWAWLSHTGKRKGLYGNAEEAAILVASSILTFSLLIRRSMDALAHSEASRTKAEEDLKTSEEHLRMALDAARVGTWELDIGAGKVRWSAAFEDLFGLPKAAFDGRFESYLSFIHPEDRNLVQTRIRRALEGIDESYRVEYRVLRADATVRWLSSRGNVFRDESKKPIRLAGTSIDVTERKLLERELIEASSREQRRPAEDLHEDVGQWLTALQLEARTLSMQLRSKSEAEAAQAEKIVSYIGEVTSRTHQLARALPASKIEAGGLAAALNELASETERLYDIHCYCDCSAGVTVHNTGAALQLYRIAQEAINNAVRHGEATEITVCLDVEEAGYVRLRIRDNGRGVPQPLPKAPGMGIRIMQHRARLLGSTVDIHTAEGGGTEVICRFPTEL